MIRALIADDHPVVRNGLRALIESRPDLCVVSEVGDGRAAVAETLRLRPDLVILDIMMPELNGIDAAQQIHAAYTTLPILILSMHSTAEHIYRALCAGARGYLIKESVGEEVLDAIDAIMAGRRYLSRDLSDRLIDDYVAQRITLEPTDPLARLSVREREVLQLVVEGNSSAEIAGRLALSTKTVETYRSRLMQKLGIEDIPGLVKFAIQYGVTSL